MNTEFANGAREVFRFTVVTENSDRRLEFAGRHLDEGLNHDKCNEIVKEYDGEASCRLGDKGRVTILCDSEECVITIVPQQGAIEQEIAAEVGPNATIEDSQTQFPLKQCQCFNGEPEGEVCFENKIEMCKECIEGYRLNLETSKCDEKKCLCENGYPSQEIVCEHANEERCDACKPGYYLKENKCFVKQCNCDDGTPVGPETCPEDGNTMCAECNQGFTKNPKGDLIFCIENQCVCCDGMPATGQACEQDRKEICVSCDEGFILKDSECAKDESSEGSEESETTEESAGSDGSESSSDGSDGSESSSDGSDGSDSSIDETGQTQDTDEIDATMAGEEQQVVQTEEATANASEELGIEEQ
jgi:hypothetical protein